MCITLGFSLFLTLLLPGANVYGHENFRACPTASNKPRGAPFHAPPLTSTCLRSLPYMAGWPSYAPFWGLLGEFDLESVSTFVPSAPDDPNSMLVPLFLWLYCFIATVILVNLP